MKKLFLFFILFTMCCILPFTVTAQTWPPLGMAGAGTSENPWQISTPAHLEALAGFVNAGNGSATSGVYYKMMNNINLNNYSNWEPIGNYYSSDASKRFQGHFDGNNYAVQNLTINRPSEDFIGLFGYVYGSPNPASIKNLGVEGCDIVGQSRTGSLVGHSVLSPISNCYATGIVSGVQYTGGLVGSGSSYIDESYTAVTVTGSTAGGIAGDNSSAIVNCYTTGNVNGGSGLGGVAGSGNGIFNCYATGNVRSTGQYVGGVVGNLSAYGQLRDCVAANDSVTTTHTSTANINRVYGNESLFTITLRNNYANSAMVVRRGTSTVPTPNALNGGAGMGKTLAELKVETFYTTSVNWYDGAWDFPIVWKMCESYLPIFQWQVCPLPLPIITTTSLPDGITNTAYNQQLTATGGTPITWSLASGSLPTGLTLSASGEITGTPTAENTFYFLVKATNSAGSDTKVLTIIVTAPPVITTTTLPSGVVGTLYFQMLTSTGTTPITWTLESGNLPNNLSLSTAGVLSGTPTTAGTFNFTVKATNSAGSDTKALAIIVTAPPTITTTTLPGGVVGTAYNQTLTATGTTPITWTISSGNLPNGLTLSSAGIISGMPNTAGTFNFTVKATNSAGSDTKALVIIVTTPPIITTTTLPGGVVGTAYNQTLTATGTTPISWTLESGSLPNNLTLSTAGVISGTPSTTGTFNFTVKATNSVGNDTKALSIAITAASVPPTITTTTLPDGTTGIVYNTQLEATGTAPITWTLESGSLPNNLTLSTSGVISGTPNTAGTFNFTVKATNSVGNDTKALSIAVTAAPVPPAITTITLPNGKTGSVYNAQLEATGTTPITWTLESGSLPNNLILSTAGVISGTLTEAGIFNFTVQATNSVGNDTKALSIFIDGVGISENEMSNIIVYPNPTTGELRIESDKLEIERVEIIDMLGKRYAIRVTHREKESTVDMLDLPTGIYFVKIHTEMGEVIRKVVKE